MDTLFSLFSTCFITSALHKLLKKPLMLKLFKLWFDNMNLLINQNIKARCACVSLYVGKGDNIECRRMTVKKTVIGTVS